MSLSWVVPGTNIIYNRSSTLKRVPAVVLGPSKRDGDFLSIQDEVKGRTVTQDCSLLHWSECHICSPSPPRAEETIQQPHGNNYNHQLAFKKNKKYPKATGNSGQIEKSLGRQKVCLQVRFSRALWAVWVGTLWDGSPVFDHE